MCFGVLIADACAIFSTPQWPLPPRSACFRRETGAAGARPGDLGYIANGPAAVS
jgi:hypothetical protein